MSFIQAKINTHISRMYCTLISSKYFTIFGHRSKTVLESVLVLTQWASYKIRKIAGAHAPGTPGMFSPPPRASDPDMHHGTCVTHVPWCMPGSLTSGFLWSRWRGKTFPAFAAHAQPAILRIWQEAHRNVNSTRHKNIATGNNKIGSAYCNVGKHFREIPMRKHAI